MSTEKSPPNIDSPTSSSASTIRHSPPPSITKNASPPPTTSPPPEESRSKAQTALIITALSSALFLAALDVTIITVAIPTIASEFSSTAGYTWIGSAYMLSSAACAPIWGKVSDIWGRKVMMLIAVAIFWIGSLLSAITIQGAGGGGVIILVNVCISDLFSMRKRGVYFGVMGIVWAVAGAIGPVLGGVFTSKVSWRWCFYINLPISGVGFGILALVLRLHNPRTSMREGLVAVDWLGSLTFGGVKYSWSSATVLGLIVFGVVTAGIFVVIEWKVAKFPLMPLRLFRRRASLASLGTAAFQAMAVLGASPLMSGIYILPFVLSLSKTGRYLECIVLGMAIMTPKANWPKIVVYQIIAGIGVGPNFQAPLIALQSTVEGRDMAAATATFGFVRQLFTSISVVIGGVVFQNKMQEQYPRLLAELGPEAADLLSGKNAASSVGRVQELPEQDQDVAHLAYFESLKTMYIMYVVFAAVGTKDHQEHKTGLQAMKEEEARRLRATATTDFPTLTSAALVALASLSDAASLQRVNNFGSNPSNIRAYIYVPDRLASNPALITAVHYCGGTASAFQGNTNAYRAAADQQGFIVLYPESPNSGGCWDVSSPASLTRGGGGDSNSIANFVNWAITQYNVDRNKVFLTGLSSGAMMTNVLSATYPDLFKAATAYAGVSAGCFRTGTVAGWNNTCAEGRSISTQAHWASVATGMYPGYTGSRPRMMIYHGSQDEIINAQNFQETMKQWAGVFGYTYGSPQQTLNNNPGSPYTKYVYGDQLVGVYGAGVTHNIPMNAAHDLQWFGLTGNTAPVTSSTRVSTTSVAQSTTFVTSSSTTTSAAAPTATGCVAQRWAQCGGQGFNGCTVCASPYTCTFSNNWYSQCL
ncbi:hypothetical protein QBC38DRAFT_533772 [Podospora fimiseda]|uniref:Carboxylic ester hydrolase n=1 Tax=Podospora fimiseda TaxID=252190 RepID=A0AAN7BWW8_9PEZI|nr:hypothetical protein QBC38DRAFT_533772 [Podospora fimiseda]